MRSLPTPTLLLFWLPAALVVPAGPLAGVQAPGLGGQLSPGVQLAYFRDGAAQPPWTVDSIRVATGEMAGADCVLIHLRQGANSPAGPDRLCLRSDTLYQWSRSTSRWEGNRPVGPGMRWSTRRPNGDSVHYETGSRAEEMIGDLRVVVVPTVVTTVDSLGRPKARLRERFALALATATGGTFERPDPAASGQWKPQSTFVLKELRHPATGTAPPVESALIPDTTLPIPPLQFDSSGALVIRPSPSSSQRDFDFLIGKWKLRNRNLKSRLTNSTEWITFESQVEMHQILNGLGNIDRYTDSSTGRPFEGVALRLFNPATRLWSIYWADSNTGTLDPPVVGSFANQVGHFFTRHSYKGRKIIMVFRWDLRNPQFPVWSQAFSTDEGKSWEWNSINVSTRVGN